MFHVDVLSAYLICGVSALVGAAMLRVTETDRRDAFQKVAPQTEAGLYLVPKVIE